MYALDIFLESTGAMLCEDVEATNIGIEPNMEGILQICNESCEEMHQIDKGILAASAKCLQEGASMEFLHEAASGKKITDKIKEVIKKMWAKIKEFFNKFKLYISKLFASNKSFAEKYKEEIGKLGSVEIEGYDFKFQNVNIEALAKEGKAVIDKPMVDSSTAKNDMSRKMSGYTADKFVIGIKEKIGYTPKKVTVTYNGSEMISLLTGEAVLQNDVNKAANAVDKAYKEVISNLDKATGAIKDTDDEKQKKKDAKTKETNTAKVTAYKTLLEFVNKISGIVTKAIADNAKQAKMAAYKGIAESRGKKPEEK